MPLLPYLVLPTPVHAIRAIEAKDVFAGDPFPNPWVEPGFQKIEWVQSPNFGRRPNGPDTVVDTVVIHSTVIPTLEKTALAFYLQKSQVSAHYVIGKDGSIVQTVSTFCRAWHAGVSRDSLGRNNLNNFSVGIELVNLDDGKDPYPEAQIKALKSIIQALERRHPIKYLTSHEYVALPHGRKNDPAGFPWEKLKDLNLQITYIGQPPTEATKN